MLKIMKASDNKNLTKFKNIDSITEEALENEFGSILSSLNNMIINSENRLISSKK